MPADRGARLRGLAASVNAAVVDRGESLDRALQSVTDVSARDMPLLRAISYGALRWHHRIQWQVERLLDKPLDHRAVALAALLRVGLFQLQWLRVPEHAAVAATVDAAALIGAGRAKGLVNAVLRRFLRERAALDARMRADPEALTSHPRWLLELIDADWSGEAETIIAANNASAPMWLRVNARRTSRQAYVERLAAEGIEASMDDAPECVLLAEPRPVASLPGYAEGLVSVQDRAAQLAAGLLDPQPGQRVLDACAAPGGKTAHLLETYPQLGTLVALDIDAERLTGVGENLARLGLEAELCVGDAALPEGWWDGVPFDRILLDAPCSALGVIRRHPDIKLLRRASDIPALAARQAGLLSALWRLLAPGGRLLYATCTIARQENETQMRAFQETHADVEISAGSPRGRQILPGEANMDGFYYACLAKREVK